MDARLRRLAILALVGSAGVLAGCGTGVRTGQAIPESPSAPMSPSMPAPSPALAPDFADVFPALPVPTLAGEEPCAVWPDTECTMGPGHYYSTSFHVAFDLPTGTWTNTVNWPNAVALTDGERSITFMSGPPGQCWYPDFCYGWGVEPYLGTPAAIRRHLAADTSSLAVSPRLRATIIDGRAARSVDVDSLRHPEDRIEWPNHVLSIESGGYWMDQGQSARLQFLEIDGEMVVVILEASTASFDSQIAALQPVLDSVRFEDWR